MISQLISYKFMMLLHGEICIKGEIMANMTFTKNSDEKLEVTEEIIENRKRQYSVKEIDDVIAYHQAQIAIFQNFKNQATALGSK